MGGWGGRGGVGPATAGMAQGMLKEVAAGLSPPVMLHTLCPPPRAEGSLLGFLEACRSVPYFCLQLAREGVAEVRAPLHSQGHTSLRCFVRLASFTPSSRASHPPHHTL